MTRISEQFYFSVFLLNCLTIFQFNAEEISVRLGRHFEDLDYDENSNIIVTQGHQVIRNTVRVKRSSRMSAETAAGHLPDITVAVTVFNETFNLDMKLNRNLFAASYKEKYFNSSGVFYNDVDLTTHHCYYLGSVRHRQHSTAAVSTCEGVVGFFAIGNISYHIEPLSDQLQGPHRVYRSQNDTKTMYRCGLDDVSIDSLLSHSIHKRRVKRSFLWPQDLDKQTKVVELYVANDRSQFLSLGSDVNAVFKRAKAIINIASSAFQSQSIYLVLVGMEVWTDNDRIILNASNSGSISLLNAWASYRMTEINPLYNNDHATLITNQTLDANILGLAYQEGMCSNRMSASFIKDVYPLVTVSASNMVHQIGHSFGQAHDDNLNNCTCSGPTGDCIMKSYLSPANPSLTWSQCSIDRFKLEFEQRGLDICLYNIPEMIYTDTSYCGNGIVENGEQCDCGNSTSQQCNSSCCNQTTCQLITLSKCAYGRCCNIATCQLLRCGSICRQKTNDCDLTELCNGEDPLCPEDTHIPDGTNCSESAYCYEGLCKSRESQCELIYGSGTPDGNDSCYTSYNGAGQAYGNCGMKWLPNVTYIPCESSDVMCGRLQCEASSFQLPYYNLAYSKLEWTLGTHKCYSVVFDYGLKTQDPGLVPNGAACGTDKMCLNQKCVNVSSIPRKSCATQCQVNEICNNVGKCQRTDVTTCSSSITSGGTTLYDSGQVTGATGFTTASTLSTVPTTTTNIILASLISSGFAVLILSS